ncbi:MAG: 2-oxo acid dehydrogenase subunit E2, partial [Marmoricola sp.]
MPESTEDSSRSGFGANEWLVDEMYERYQKDPDSVDKVWWDFFGKDQRATAGSASSSGSSNGSSTTSASTTSNGSVKESTGAPKSRPTGGEKSSKVESKPESQKSEQKSASKPAAKQESKPESKTDSKTDTKAGSTTDKQPAKAAEKDTKSASSGSGKSTQKEAEEKTESAAKDEPTYTVLKGAPARTVANMDASLTVPTATSVRSVPVKLLWDNRIVINNHLARARGGKVSFTHLIGFALVRALKSMPEMNVGFDEIDGKPNQITPAHINLGLAIDLPKPDGTRQLLVPSIKAAETMDFAHFWTAYEELVR